MKTLTVTRVICATSEKLSSKYAWRLLICSVYLLQALMIVGWYKQDDSDNPEIVDFLIRNNPLLEELEFLNSNKTVLAMFRRNRQ